MQSPVEPSISSQQDPAVRRGRSVAIDKSAVLNLATEALREELNALLGKNIEILEEQLNKDDNAESNGAVKFDFLQKFKQSAAAVYLKNIESKFLDFVPSVKQVSNDEADTGIIGLELVDNDEVEEKIFIESIIARAEKKHYQALFALNKRLPLLFDGLEMKASDNPLGPKVLMSSYMDLIKENSVPREIRSVSCESFERAVLNNLAGLYEKVNQICIGAGVLPKLPKAKVKRKNEGPSPTHSTVRDENQYKESHKANVSPTSAASSTGSTADSSGQMSPIMSEIPAEMHAQLVEMAQLQRSKTGISSDTENLVVTGDKMQTGELLGSLTDLQKLGYDGSASLRSQIGGQVQVNGERQPYTENDDVLIDVVGMFFDVILQDKQLPDRVRFMIAQLQIPILKVIMIDKDFFAKKSHPARHFLNSLSKAGLGVGKKSLQQKSIVFEKMETLVERVLMEFECDTNIFSELCDEFESFMEQQQQQVDVIEERARQATQNAEKLELSRRKAAYEISLRVQGKKFPDFVNNFLADAWKDVLVLAILREDREPSAPEKFLRVVDSLMASVVEPEDQTQRELVISLLPSLIKDLKVGLENISYDFHRSIQWFKDLEAWHREMLIASAGKDIGLMEGKVEMVEAKAEGPILDLEEDLLQELEDELSQMPKDKFTKKVNAMLIGDWVEYQDSDGQDLRAKLSWKSAVTLKCLFVNEKGLKALDLSLPELAEALREKRLVLLGQEKAPLVERVLSSMKSFITGGNEELVTAG